MPRGRRLSSSASDESGGPPKKQKIETKAVMMDPIDHSLDLEPPPPPFPPPDDNLDSFALEFGDIDDELHTGGDEEQVHEDEVIDSPIKQDEPDSPVVPVKQPQPQQQPTLSVAEIMKTYDKRRLERIRRQFIKDAREEYREETERVVQQLPAEITSKFGEVGYAKFGKKWFPVLLICPYDVALESVRVEWYKTFEKALEGKSNFSHLGYWIGEKSYTPFPQSNFVPLDQATKIHTKAVDAAKKKLAKGTLIKENSDDAYLLRAHDEMDKLLAMTPEERRKTIPQRRHPFEDMKIEEVLHDIQEGGISIEAFENDISDDEGLEELSDVVDDELDEDDDEDSELSDIEEVKAKQKKRSKPAKEKAGSKGKKKAAKKKLAFDEKDESQQPPKKKKAKAQSASTEQVTLPPADTDTSEAEFDEEEIPSDDDEKDEDFDLDAEGEPINAVADLGVVGELGVAESSPRKKKDAPSKKPKVARAKSPAKKPEIPAKDKTDRQKRDWVFSRFKSNEKNIVPLLEQLSRVNDSTKTEKIDEMLQELNDFIERMCWVFIELHKVPAILKPAKKELKARGKDVAIISQLREKMKSVYEENKRDYNLAFAITPTAASYLEGSDLKKRMLNGGSAKSGQKPTSDAAKTDASTRKRATLDSPPRTEKKSIPLESKAPLGKLEKKRHSTGSLNSLDERTKKPRLSMETPKTADGQSVENARDSSEIPRQRSVEKNLGSLSKDSGRKSPAKPKPKFSLSSLIKPGNPEKDQEKAVAQPPKVTVPRTSTITKTVTELPLWMREGSTKATLPRNRLFGLEYFKEMTQSFTTDKVHSEAMAVALEKATFEWASENTEKATDQEEPSSRVEDTYWKKVRALVAVVSGKNAPGALTQDILKGKFAEPRDLVSLSEKNLLKYL